jgi:KDO2-lipid IV(A) lauroyltransferase
MSKKSFEKRYYFDNIEEIKELVINSNRGAVINAAHQFNWEWMIYVGAKLPEATQAFISYTPLSNKLLDKLIRKNRERFGLKLASASRFMRTLENTDKSILPISGLISDQSPKSNYKFHADFFGVNVPVYTGPENIAKKFNQSYWFLNVKKVKRGHYLVHFELIDMDVSNYKDGELTKIGLRKTEELIRQQPENYLWTHRRWKHRKD